MLHDLWNEVSLHFVADKYQVERGHIQNLMTSAATFASNVVSFCTEMEEFWAFTHLLKGISQRLQHCCRRELIPLMELPAVKQVYRHHCFNNAILQLFICRLELNNFITLVLKRCKV